MKTTTIITNMVHDDLQGSAWLNFLLYHVINDHVINGHVISDHKNLTVVMTAENNELLVVQNLIIFHCVSVCNNNKHVNKLSF